MITNISPGDAILTKFGVGVVVRCFDDEHIVSHVRPYPHSTSAPTRQSQQDSDRPASAASRWASVRLWRQPGKSIASCAVATLRLEEGVVVKRLVAAPGMIVRSAPIDEMDDSDRDETKDSNQKDDEKDQKLYLIENYLPLENVYLASSVVDTEDATKAYQYLHPHQIHPSTTSAKFYPILEGLIARGEAAWNLAHELKSNVSSVTANIPSAVTVTTADGEAVNVAKLLADTSKSSIETVNKTLEDKSETSQTNVVNMTVKEALVTAKSAATELTSAAIPEASESPLPQAEVISQIYKMLRDDNLTELFVKGRERLQQLVGGEIPIRTKKALSAMGIELDDDKNTSGKQGKKSMNALRKEALSSLNQILKIDVSDDGDIVLQTNANNREAAIQINTKCILDPSLLPRNDVKQRTQKQFAQMFDNLSAAAKSDPQLVQIFAAVSDRTKSWQEMTGRLLQTKTASLLTEGSQRLKSRAADILNVGQEQLRNALGNAGSDEVGGSGEELTRAFTEGDIAIAKLKSMELGDAIRSQLFAAIELRSESKGGLDAIIMATLQSKKDRYGSKMGEIIGRKKLQNLSLSSIASRAAANSEGISEDVIQSAITDLQSTATSTMKETKETLIALLSQRSGVRDTVLNHLEQVFLDLESSLGQDMSAEDIANLASGEEGSLALFRPIALKAGKAIESQLDLAEAKMRESKHWDPKADDVIRKVRQITGGEMNMVEILDMATEYLDNEKIVAESGGLIVKAEILLDDFEAASARLSTTAERASKLDGIPKKNGIMDAVAKAGINKDAVMKSFESLDVNKVISTTQNAMTDEAARRELISCAGDIALDFLLEILPSMPVPPFDGVREGLVYHLSNLSLAGFKVKKENIFIEIAGIQAAAQSEWDIPDSPQPHAAQKSVKASELLIIDIKNIFATLDDAVWSFEQTYMPYLKGSGKANTRLWDGAIRLKFELRRRMVNAGGLDPVTGRPINATWEPCLCLNDRSCSIGGVEVTIQGESRITWVANKLVSVLKNPLRDYVVSVIINALKNNSGWLIEKLNQNLGNYWDFILKTAKLELEKLPKLARHHVTEAESDPDEEMVELVWRERVPLGLNLLTNDSSGYLKVIDFPRGTQARKVAQSKQLDPDLFKGATIERVNGRKYGPENQVELFSALKDPSRPKAILFQLASQEDLEKLESVVSRNKKTASPKKGASSDGNKSANLVTIVDILEKGDIGLKFTSIDNFALAVSDFLRDSSNQALPAEQSGSVFLGDLLSHINGSLVLGSEGKGNQKALSLFEQIGPNQRPLSLGFAKPYLYKIILEKNTTTVETASFGGPSELIFVDAKPSEKGLSNQDNRILLKDFALVEGATETGGVFVGDNLVFVNGIPVGAGCRLLKNGPSPSLVEVIAMLKQLSPLALTFARAQAEQTSTVKTYLTSSPLSLNIESAYTFSIAAEDYSHIGCTFVKGMNGADIVVNHMSGVDGPFKRQMTAARQPPFVGCKLESIDGEVVLLYMNSQLITNALKRRWATNDRLELTFCNEMHRDALCKVKEFNVNAKK